MAAPPAASGGAATSSLDGKGWTLEGTNKSGKQISVPAATPASLHTALLAAGELDGGDPVYRYNELHYRWVAQQNWTLSRDAGPALAEAAAAAGAAASGACPDTTQTKP